MPKISIDNTNGSYTLHRRDGTEIVLSSCEVSLIACKNDESYRRDDLAMLLEEFQNEDGTYDIGSFRAVILTEEQAKNLVEDSITTYISNLGNDDGWRCFGVNTLIDKYEELFRGDIPSDICVCEYCKTAIPWGGSDTQRGSIWSCEVCGNDFCEACFKEKHYPQVAHEMFSIEGDVDDIHCPPCFTKHQEAGRADTNTLVEFQDGGDA